MAAIKKLRSGVSVPKDSGESKFTCQVDFSTVVGRVNETYDADAVVNPIATKESRY